MLLGDDLAVELVGVALFLLEHLSRQASKSAKPWSIRRVRPRSSQTVARDRFSRKRRSWLISTSAERMPSDLALQPFDGGQVEMVGRLVEQQDVGLGREHAGQRGAAGFAARELGRVFLAGQAELVPGGSAAR